jgi:NADH-quinone oxidoreductase subunit H
MPRIRVDQLMGMAWKVMLPIALVNLFLTAIVVVVFDL